MEKEWKELMRVTNILCGKVFEFCRSNTSSKKIEVAAVITQKLCDIIEFMENPDNK